MRHWPARTRRTARIELIPMIDVMLFLLVFFVLISANVLPALGLKVALPQAGSPDRIPSVRHVTLTVVASGAVYVDGQEVAIDALPARVHSLAAPGTKLDVVIAADRAARTEALIGVLDVLKGAGIQAASIITDRK